MTVFFIFVAIYIVLFLIIDILQKRVFITINWSRRATHILSGVVSFFLPVYLTRMQVVFISFSFVLVLAASKWMKMLSMHNTSRKTWGEILYPLAIALMALLFLPESIKAYQFGILVLAFADAFAGIVGEWLNYKPMQIGKHIKSLGGCITFFIVFLIISFGSFGFHSHLIIPILLGGLIFTAMEFFLVYGFDNLIIPIAAAYFFQLLSSNCSLLLNI